MLSFMTVIDIPSTVSWRVQHFAELSADALYELLRLRADVFVVEQNCVYLDIDGHDRHPGVLHLSAWEGAPGAALPVAYCRVLPPGLTYPQVSFGRVVVKSTARGRGLAQELGRRALDEIARHWPGQPVHISAQAYLQAFYESLGFGVEGEPYLEDGIPHLGMTLRP